jgi:hypothetical protein
MIMFDPSGRVGHSNENLQVTERIQAAMSDPSKN